MAARTVTFVFDLGNVLIDWDPRHLYRKLIANEAEMEHFLGHVCDPTWNVQMDAGKPFAEAVAEKVAEHPKMRHLIEAYWQRWIETVGGPIDGSRRILEALHLDGRRLLALSNWSTETFALVRHRKGYGFLGLFERIYLSGELRMVKPHPEIFHHLLQASDLAAGECLFIDDSAANIATASRLGFLTHHFRGPEALSDDLEARGLLP